MIENPKYKGYYRARTYEILDYRTKRRKKNSLEEQVLYKCEDGSIPVIISEELWDQANKILKSRTKGYKSNDYWSGGLKYAFSSKYIVRNIILIFKDHMVVEIRIDLHGVVVCIYNID